MTRRYCEGCGAEDDLDGPVHVNDYCKGLWERKKLLAVAAAARRVADSFDSETVGLKPIEQALVDALSALEVAQRHGEEP